MMILCGALHAYFYLRGEYDAKQTVDFSVPVVQTGLTSISALYLGADVVVKARR